MKKKKKINIKILIRTYRDLLAGVSSVINLSEFDIAFVLASVAAAVVMILCCNCWYRVGALVTTLCTVLDNEVAVNGTDTTILFEVVVGDWVTIDDWDCVTAIITGVVVTSVATGVFDDDWMGLSTFNLIRIFENIKYANMKKNIFL